jgi:hypothetical protein
MFRRDINQSESPVASAVITTDGSGAIAIASSSAEFTSVAFTTDGSNGSLTATIKVRSATYRVSASAASATAPLAVAQVGTPTTTTFVLIVSDLATPTVVNIATTAVRINVFIQD